MHRGTEGGFASVSTFVSVIIAGAVVDTRPELVFTYRIIDSAVGVEIPERYYNWRRYETGMAAEKAAKMRVD